jgi:hypothetical protein
MPARGYYKLGVMAGLDPAIHEAVRRTMPYANLPMPRLVVDRRGNPGDDGGEHTTSSGAYKNSMISMAGEPGKS